MLSPSVDAHNHNFMVLKLNEIVLKVVVEKIDAYISTGVHFSLYACIWHDNRNIYSMNPKSSSIIVDSGIFHNPPGFGRCFYVVYLSTSF